MGVLHLHILVAHQCPSGQIRPVEPGGTFEVLDGLLVFISKREIVP